MCKNVMWTAGCTFDSVDEANAAAAKADTRVSAGAECKNVMWTAGCTFGTVEEAMTAAKPHLDNLVASGNVGCGSVLTTLACTL